jgi:succinate dehydrogenase / fumarate reductase cytochrome b subunit
MTRSPFDDTPARARPLSPHLQVWKPTLSMTLSIVHRITGAALYLGAALLVWWLMALASGPEAFATAQGVFGSILGKLVLFGFTWALIHHTVGGVRHLVWDTGHGLDLKSVHTSGLVSIAVSIALTFLIWIVALAMGGGA